MYYENYAKLRDERGLTDYRVAISAGVSTATMSEWKNSAGNNPNSSGYTPKADKLLAISKVLGVSLEEIVKEE